MVPFDSPERREGYFKVSPVEGKGPNVFEVTIGMIEYLNSHQNVTGFFCNKDDICKHSIVNERFDPDNPYFDEIFNHLINNEEWINELKTQKTLTLYFTTTIDSSNKKIIQSCSTKPIGTGSNIEVKFILNDGTISTKTTTTTMERQMNDSKQISNKRLKDGTIQNQRTDTVSKHFYYKYPSSMSTKTTGLNCPRSEREKQNKSLKKSQSQIRSQSQSPSPSQNPSKRQKTSPKGGKSKKKKTHTRTKTHKRKTRI
jgi:hypothetical protein